MLLDSICCITALPDLFQDVIISAITQKNDVSNEELVEALNYYLENDTFMMF